MKRTVLLTAALCFLAGYGARWALQEHPISITVRDRRTHVPQLRIERDWDGTWTLTELGDAGVGE
jgi:hypothetical protein